MQRRSCSLDDGRGGGHFGLVDFKIPRGAFALLRNFGRAPALSRSRSWSSKKHFTKNPDLIAHRSESDRCDINSGFYFKSFLLDLELDLESAGGRDTNFEVVQKHI